MIDHLRQLAIFSKTIDHGSFRGAAGELGLSPSVVSHHISQLESHLGVALIYRSTRKLSLTKEGKRLLFATHKMLAAIEGELLDISESANEPSGELRITIPSVLSQSSLTMALAKFLEAYPRIKLSLDYSDSKKQLIEDGFDIAIRMWTKAKETLTTETLFTVKRRLVAATSYIKLQSDITDPKELLDWDWLMLSPVHIQGHSLKKAKQKVIRIKPKAKVYSSDARSIYTLVQSGIGIAALPETLIKEDVANGKLQYVLPEWKLSTLSVFVEWPANAPKQGLIKLLIKYLSSYQFEQ